MVQRGFRLLFIIVGLVLLYFAYETYGKIERAEGQKRGVFVRVRSVANEISQLKDAPLKPLEHREKAVQDLLARMVDDTELLGSSVRFDLERQLSWQPIKYGVEKARIQMSTAALSESAMGFFAILWSLIQERPLNIIDGTIRMQEEAVTFTVTLELFGLSTAPDGGAR